MPSRGPVAVPHAALIEQIVVGLGFDDPWRGIEVIAREFVLPAFEKDGFDALRVLAEEKAKSPWAAAALVELAARKQLSPLVFFNREDLLRAAAAYLVAPSFDRRWAWMAVWFGSFDREEHLGVVLELVDRAPDDDDALWRIGDGPIAELEMYEGMSERIADLSASRPKLAKVLRLVRELP